MPSCRSRKYTIKENFMALKGNKSDLLQKKLKKVFLSFKNWTAVKRWRNFWICWQWGWGWLHWLSPGCGSCVFPGPGLALSGGRGGGPEVWGILVCEAGRWGVGDWESFFSSFLARGLHCCILPQILAAGENN